MKLLVANLKMNLSMDEIINYKKVIEDSDINNLIICPPNIYLSLLKSDKYSLSSQNGYYIDKGAYTGEVSFFQLNSLGIKYSLIGHSERRHVFNESDELISLKVDSCIKNKIIPILCVGETKEERDNGNILKVIENQIDIALDGKNIDNIIIAYEPVWAIGTGVIPTINEINEVHLHIKEMSTKYNINVNILYGGSVNSSNIKEICNLDSVDGVLIGSASNDPNNLIDMYNEIK